VNQKNDTITTPFKTHFESVLNQRKFVPPAAAAVAKRIGSGSSEKRISEVQDHSGFVKSQEDYNVFKHQEDKLVMPKKEHLTRLYKNNPAEYIYKTFVPNQVSVSHASFPKVSAYHNKEGIVNSGNLKEPTGSVRNIYPTFLYSSDYNFPVLSETQSR
jgi:hypothetical protein